MKTNMRILGLATAAALLLAGCVKEDLDDLRREQAEQAERIAALEAWQTTVNENIRTLQELLAALQDKDYVTGVEAFDTPAPGGYKITFSKSGEATIWNGAKGDKGDPGIAPVVGVAEWPEGSGEYFWTIDGEFIVTAGQKIPVTGPQGDKGQTGTTPKLRINPATGYWEVSYDEGQSWISLDVKATGDKGDKGESGDAIFARDGVDASDENYVVFTLVDGTKITLPKFAQDPIAFDSNELFVATATKPIVLRFPPNFKESDYTMLTASIKFENGSDWDMQTRASASPDRWQVSVAKPTFTDGVLDEGSATVTITATEEVWLAETALLTVTLTDKNGKDHSISRPVKYFDGLIVRNPSPGSLRPILEEAEGDGEFTTMNLGVIGAIDDKDAEAISDFFSKYEGYLDLSLSDKEKISFRGIMKRIILPPNAKQINKLTCDLLESIENCGNIEYIRERAFEYMSQLTRIELPKAYYIGDYAFFGCTNLKTVVLGDALGGLPESCFEESGLVSIELPKNVWSISKRAFFGCRKLESVVLDDDGLSQIGVSAFEECTSLKRIKIPRGVTEIESRTFYNCTSLTTLDIVEKEIGGASISIQDEAFAHCTSLIETAHTPGVLHLEHSVDGEYAFEGCTSLKTVICDSGNVADNAFVDCTNLEKVSFWEGMGRIGHFAFENTALKSVSLPPYLYEIGDGAFDGCSDLHKIYSYMEIPPLIDEYNNPFDPDYAASRQLFVPKENISNYLHKGWFNYVGPLAGDVPGPFEENR